MDTPEDLLPQSNRLQILSPEEYELLWNRTQPFGTCQMFYTKCQYGVKLHH